MAMEGTETASPTDAMAEIKEVVGKAKRGDTSAVPRLRALLDQHPENWEKYGDLAAQVEGSWVTLASGTDLHLKESLTRYAAKLRSELTRPSAGAIEKLLVERAVGTWLQLHYFSAMEANAVEAQVSPRMLEHWARRQAQAQRLHERALSSLLTMQKLLPDSAVPTPIRLPSKTDAVGASTVQRPGDELPRTVPFVHVDDSVFEDARPEPLKLKLSH